MREPHRPPAIVLMTDFGLADTYVGQMKGVILTIAPEARIIDLTHSINPQNVAEGAFLLQRALPYLPPASTIITVVDPGVGTARRAIAIESQRQTFLAPDNGLLTPILVSDSPVRCFEITDRRYISPERSRTFHGRDIFSPAAAHLATGVPLENLGNEVDIASCRRIPLPVATPLGNAAWKGEILFADRFGNLVTSISSECAAENGPWILSTGTITLPISSTYGDVPDGAALAYPGSFGTLEIAIHNDNALQTLNILPGTPVTLNKGTTEAASA
ncbi:MAG: SAM-dependent chlorinase/fluorinase [Chlorobium phaeovibrioides]|nr:SAM-dependent chlorinase/fluorinase [Chlorobium phaeovibrioides]